jgi:hypothetical protein
MSGSLGECLHSKRACLALVLCLVAFLFAVEAKTAWFGPVFGLGSNVRAAKAMPADSPKVIEHGLPVLDPAHPQLLVVALNFVAIATIAGANLHVVELISLAQIPQFTRVHLSPSLFFRPPPTQ